MHCGAFITHVHVGRQVTLILMVKTVYESVVVFLNIDVLH